MPTPYKGRRVRVQARLPYDLANAAAQLARDKRWSMSELVNYCVEREVARAHRRLEPAPRPLVDTAVGE